MSVLDHALAVRYAAKLTHEYKQVTELALVAAHGQITREVTWLLQNMESAPLPPALIAKFQALATTPRQLIPISLDERVASLCQLVVEAVDSLTSGATHLTQLGDRYDSIEQALSRVISGDETLTRQLGPALASFIEGTQARFPSLLSKLVEARFDTPEFTRLLTDELLDQRALHQLLAEILSSALEQQAQRWREAASDQQLRLEGEPQRPTVDMDALLKVFLEPIQLVYERPSMLRSIANALNRGKINDKLTQEINVALTNVGTQVTTQLRQHLSDVEQQWYGLTRQAATTWFVEQTGIRREELETRLSQWEQHRQTLQHWSERLQKITLEHILSNWRSGLTHMALVRIVKRVAGEAQRQ
jgi:hypothetical protein